MNPKLVADKKLLEETEARLDLLANEFRSLHGCPDGWYARSLDLWFQMEKSLQERKLLIDCAGPANGR
jgi:hypothetical protein